MYPEMESIPCASFEDAFELVSSGEAELAMIPIENSIAGRVADIHVLLPQSKLQIVGEFFFLPIHFDRMGIPGSTIEGATEVHSHIHALGQCRKLIREAGLRPVIAGDTAGSAREVSEWNDPAQAIPLRPAHGRPDLRAGGARLTAWRTIPPTPRGSWSWPAKRNCQLAPTSSPAWP